MGILINFFNSGKLYFSMICIFILFSFLHLRKKTKELKVKYVCLDQKNYKEITKKDFLTKQDGLKILYISDLHIDNNWIPNQLIEQALTDIKTQAILFGGDLACSLDNCLKNINKLKPFQDYAKKLNIPFLMVPGNHDKEWMTTKNIQDLGGELLVNQSQILMDKNGKAWNIVGIDDLQTGNPSLPQKNTTIAPEHTILLAHHPDSIFDYNHTDAQYFLAGHLHGGQVYLPYHLEFKLMSWHKERIVKEKHVYGYYKRNGIQGFISSGLGCSNLPFRFRTTGELVFIHIEY